MIRAYSCLFVGKGSMICAHPRSSVDNLSLSTFFAPWRLCVIFYLSMFDVRRSPASLREISLLIIHPL